MSNRPKRYDVNLPRNLTFRKAKQIYSWRNPITGQEISLGRIPRKDAISQAIEANSYIEQNYAPSALLERLKDNPEFTFSKWLERYEVIQARRNLKPTTIRIRTNQIQTLKAEFGRFGISKISTREIAVFLETYIECGKRNMAVALRSLLLDIFREAVVEGLIEKNPVEPTRTPSPEVKRGRLSLEQFIAIRQAASKMGSWLVNAMNIGLLTGQRREDITRMAFSDINSDRLFVTQSKTGHKLALPLSLELEAISSTLSGVIEACRVENDSDNLIYSSAKKGGRKPGAISPGWLTQAFAEARLQSGIEFGPNPPTFHEIRSLASRLYEVERDESFAQKLLGHKTMTMTKKYLDARGQEYVMV
ncbi:phage integrase Arm DNA-binding domain-containing protein [Rouxiella badensis]|uniref:tyrosine-type recombinase/integrase n=1 Tax=Rouxiella badensis TaxID=1646377 RepID=UPI001D134899|nr:tyrosine-type recombinase/integrase [Rouxiella badensis]MCC3717928.1 phage integrase Arm DNA-binding domain-containing protein [Rouxiella badensis]MCC3730057.1 phage integrase Arm DNA-binding domain-containing protein [Rouxiella badensis]